MTTTSYNTTTAWSHPPFGQPSQDFRFSAHHEPQHSSEQTSFTFRADQRLSAQTNPAMIHPNYSQNPSPNSRRNHRHFDAGATMVPTNAFGNPGNFQPGGDQVIESFTPVYTTPQTEWTVPPSVSGLPLPNNQNFGGTIPPQYAIHTSPTSLPQHPAPTILQAPYLSPQTTNLGLKRPRNGHIPEETGDDDLDLDGAFDAKEGTRSKLPACSRCKNLKVKCEFTAEYPTCKRCFSGNHECTIPHRKKRRAPPKREDLLNQIREQAKQIQELMAQLESGTSLRRRPSSIASSDYHITSSSGFDSPTSPHSDGLSPTEQQLGESKVIEDWISKAKQSLQAFDGFIGAGIPKSYVMGVGGLEDDSDDEDDYVNISAEAVDEYEFAIENPDGQEISVGANLRRKTSTSSIGASSTGVVLKNRKHAIENAKPALLPNEGAPIGLFAQLSLESGVTEDSTETEEGDAGEPTGIAGKDFFRANPKAVKPAVDLQNVPRILVRRVITVQEAEKLFQIYFDYMNLSVSLLDPVLYTPQNTCYRSQFLFTVICAIASRYYPERPDLYPELMRWAQREAGVALIGGTKNVDMCSAYILLSLYPVPAKKWEDQRGWLYLGLAIRTATDLNLNLPHTAQALNENHEREMLNRTRVWLNCFNLDRSTGSQYGKPPIISPSDYMANNSEDWWRRSPYNMKNFDIHICAYNAELCVMGKFIGRIYGNPRYPTGLDKDADFEKIATETDEELKRLEAKWTATLEEMDVMADPQGKFRTGLMKLAYPYARLVALSYGFQHAFRRNYEQENPFLTRCLKAAFDVVKPVLNNLSHPSHRIYLRHGPEAQSVFITFASAFLVKLLQPKFSPYLSFDMRQEIRQLVQGVVDLLGSKDIAIDDRHGPKLYSKFLRNLLAAPMARLDPSSPTGPTRKPTKAISNADKVILKPPPLDIHPQIMNSSPSSSRKSLSPPARPSALSFDTFTPSGPLDPYIPDFGVSNSLAIYVGQEDPSMNIAADFFTPSLPNYDDALMQNLQLFASGSADWRDSQTNWETLEQSLNFHDSQYSFD